jgi:hypothetical protein
MIETTIAFIAFGIIIIITGAKLWNLVSGLEFYPKQMIMILLVISIFCWGIYFTASLSALNQTQTIALETGEAIQITNNDYQTLFTFMPIFNILLLSIGAMTGIESIKYILDLVNPTATEQKMGLQKN